MVESPKPVGLRTQAPTVGGRTQAKDTARRPFRSAERSAGLACKGLGQVQLRPGRRKGAEHQQLRALGAAWRGGVRWWGWGGAWGGGVVGWRGGGVGWWGGGWWGGGGGGWWGGVGGLSWGNCILRWVFWWL